jgi:hypothetical protein
MLWCVILIALVAANAVVLWQWLRREHRPFIFNMWAPTIYSAVLTLDFIMVWLIANAITPESASGPAWLVAIGVIWTIVIALLTLFFRWVIHQELS